MKLLQIFYQQQRPILGLFCFLIRLFGQFKHFLFEEFDLHLFLSRHPDSLPLVLLYKVQFISKLLIGGFQSEHLQSLFIHTRLTVFISEPDLKTRLLEIHLKALNKGFELENIDLLHFSEGTHGIEKLLSLIFKALPKIGYNEGLEVCEIEPVPSLFVDPTEELPRVQIVFILEANQLLS